MVSPWFFVKNTHLRNDMRKDSEVGNTYSYDLSLFINFYKLHNGYKCKLDMAHEKHYSKL